MANVIIQNLLALQEIEFGPKASTPSSKEAAAALRTKIPANILGHYDRLLARGKKGCAGVTVKTKVCAECHMSIPIGNIITLIKGEDIQLCGSCGRYLYVLPKEPEAEEAATTKPTGKKRGRKKKSEQPLETSHNAP